MLHRSLARSVTLSARASNNAGTSCRVCTCKCGAAFRPPLSQTIQYQQQRGARPHPSTYRREDAARPFVLNREGAELMREERERKKVVMQWTEWQFAQFMRTMTSKQTTSFLHSWWAILRADVPRGGVPEKVFDGLLEKIGGEPPLDDLFTLAMRLVYHHERGMYRTAGRALLFNVSQKKHLGATVMLLTDMVKGAKFNHSLLKRSEFVEARGVLLELIDEHAHGYLMTIEGNIARIMGEEDRAIEMWTRATSSVASDPNDPAFRDVIRLHFSEDHPIHRIFTALTSPWIELTLLHYKRYVDFWNRGLQNQALKEREKAREFAEFGCNLDDPNSFFQAAEYFQDVDPDGNKMVTSDWLYNMTKAATTAHAKASFRLAEFYARSGWKYLEDEPPDHIKPTPFDSYPPSENNPDNLTPKPSDEIFKSAIWPNTPEDRFEIARQWLELPMFFLYAPAYLLAAQMMLEKTLWGQATAPKAAINLTPDRYTYASREDYEANIPIETPASPTPVDVPNPSYVYATDDQSRVEEAKGYLREIFYAARAIRYRDGKAKQVMDRTRRNPADIDYDPDPDNHRRELTPDVEKYLRYPDVRETWEGEIGEMEAEAMAICERERWDIYGDLGSGLVYKCGLKKS